MAATWFLAPPLAALLREINARWPGRSKVSDGSIGDAAHQARVSDHNPDKVPGAAGGPGVGEVNAIDVTVDPTGGPTGMQLVKQLVGDPRLTYVIFNRVIYSKSHGWVARPYTGPDPHTGHVHISYDPTSAPNPKGSVGAPTDPTTPSTSTAAAAPASLLNPTAGISKAMEKVSIMGLVLAGGAVLVVLGVSVGVAPQVKKVMQL